MVTHHLPCAWGPQPLEQLAHPISIFVSFIRCGIQLWQWKYTMTWFLLRIQKTNHEPHHYFRTSNHLQSLHGWPTIGLEGEPINHSTITCHPEWQVSELLSFIYHVILSTQPYTVWAGRDKYVLSSKNVNNPHVIQCCIYDIIFQKWPTKLKHSVLEPFVRHANTILKSHELIRLSGYPVSPKGGCHQMRGVKNTQAVSVITHGNLELESERVQTLPVMQCHWRKLKEEQRKWSWIPGTKMLSYGQSSHSPAFQCLRAEMQCYVCLRPHCNQVARYESWAQSPGLGAFKTLARDFLETFTRSFSLTVMWRPVTCLYKLLQMVLNTHGLSHWD